MYLVRFPSVTSIWATKLGGMEKGSSRLRIDGHRYGAIVCPKFRKAGGIAGGFGLTAWCTKGRRRSVGVFEISMEGGSFVRSVGGGLTAWWPWAVTALRWSWSQLCFRSLDGGFKGVC